MVGGAGAEVETGSAAPFEFVEEELGEATSPALALGAGEEVDVHVGGVGVEVWGVIGIGVEEFADELLGMGPGGGIALGFGVGRADVRQPLGFEPVEERGGVEDAEDVAADAVVVFEDPSEVRGVFQVGSNEDMAEDERVVEEVGAVVARVAGAEADVVAGGLVVGAAGADAEGGGGGGGHAGGSGGTRWRVGGWGKRLVVGW